MPPPGIRDRVVNGPISADVADGAAEPASESSPGSSSTPTTQTAKFAPPSREALRVVSPGNSLGLMQLALRPPDTKRQFLEQSNSSMSLFATDRSKQSEHFVGQEYTPDWNALQPGVQTYSPEMAHAMAVAAKRSFLLFEGDAAAEAGARDHVRDWQDAGFEVDFLSKPGGGSTQAFLARRGKMVIVAFRGADFGPHSESDGALFKPDFSWDGWGNGLGVMGKEEHPAGRVHKGRQGLVDEVWPQIASHVREVLESHGDASVYVGGYSLGSQVAPVAAYQLNEMENVSVDGVYTFGALRVFDNEAAVAYNRTPLGRRSWRYVNHKDIWPHVPPEWVLDFKHVGLPIYFTQHGSMEPGEVADKGYGEVLLEDGKLNELNGDHSIDAYVRLLYVWRNGGLDPLQVRARMFERFLTRFKSTFDLAVSDHNARSAAMVLDPLTDSERANVLSRVDAKYAKRLLSELEDEDAKTFADVVVAVRRHLGRPQLRAGVRRGRNRPR